MPFVEQEGEQEGEPEPAADMTRFAMTTNGAFDAICFDRR